MPTSEGDTRGEMAACTPPLRKCTELPPETQSRPTLDQSYVLFLSKLTYSRDLHTHAYCSTIHKCEKKKMFHILTVMVTQVYASSKYLYTAQFGYIQFISEYKIISKTFITLIFKMLSIRAEGSCP